MRYCLALILILLPASALGFNLNGRLTASVHSWERQNSDSTSVTHNTIHQLVSLNAKDFGVKGLSFHAYGRGFIHAEGSDSRRRFALYNTYADWKGIARRLDLRIGRQRIFAGVGRGAFDGARATVSLPHSVAVLVYAGIGVPTDYAADVMAWDEAHMYGVRVSARRWKTTFSASFANEARERTEHLDDPDGNPVELQTLARRLVGAEVKSRYFPRAEVYGRFEADAINWEPTRFQLRTWGRLSPKLRLSGELDHRRPSLPANSYLSVFSAKDNTELEATLNYAMRGGFMLSGAYAVIYYTDDETQRFRAALSRGGSSISYYRRLGYGGDRDGVTLGSRRAITPKISVRGNVNFSTYKLSDVQDDRDDTLAGVLALDYAHTGKLAASIEGQLLRNRTYDYDLRLFGKVTWWFNIKR
jgi:hypothetical protein